MTISPEIPVFLVLLIIFIGALTRATLGFGDALVTMPLLALFVSIQVASPVVAFLGIIIASSMLVMSWRMVEFKNTYPVIIASLAGIPFGLFVLKFVPEVYVKALLGIVLILFGIYNLVKPALPAMKSRFWGVAMGFLSGILGGAYNANGPPLIIYASLTRMPPEKFRANLQSYLMPTAVFIFIGHGLSGLWTKDVLYLFALSFPVIVAAIFLGTRLSKKFLAGTFDRFVYAALILMGFLMFL
jgi:uncharacterized membrane protein YfcA